MPGRDQSDRGIGKRVHESEGFFAGDGKQEPDSFILQAPNHQLSRIYIVTLLLTSEGVSNVLVNIANERQS